MRSHRIHDQLFGRLATPRSGYHKSVSGVAIITEACIGTKDRACVDVCPVQCIYEYDPTTNQLISEEEAGSGLAANVHAATDAITVFGDTMLYVNVDECTSCTACYEPDVCPVGAIYSENQVPDGTTVTKYNANDAFRGPRSQLLHPTHPRRLRRLTPMSLADTGTRTLVTRPAFAAAGLVQPGLEDEYSWHQSLHSGEPSMKGDVMPRSWSEKRERQYEHIKDSALERGESEDTAEEIAARTVNKERARAGEAKNSSRSSTDDISSGRRGGLRSHKGPGGRTRDQLYNEARKKGVKGRSKMNKAELERAVGR